MSLRVPYNNENATYFHLTLKERYSSITTGEMFAIYFEYEQTDTSYMTGFTDESLYPQTFNKFYIKTNLTGATDTQQIRFLDQGWYKYKVYTWADRSTKTNLLEMGKCYVYDNTTNAQNTPDNTDTYQETKTKYVYNRG